MLWTNYVKKSKRLFVDKNSITGFEKLKLKHSEIPAVTHLDYSSRVQTVNKKTNPNFYNLLEIFLKKQDVQSLSIHLLIKEGNL